MQTGTQNEMVFEALPALGPLYVKAAARRRAVPTPQTELKALSARVDRVRIDHDELARYRALCGIADHGVVPLPYLQVLATPLHAAIIAHADFGLPALGLVHLENSLHQHRAVKVDEVLRLSARVDEGQWDERLGYVVSLVSEAYVGDELVWESRLRALSPVRSKRSKQTSSSRRAPEVGERQGARVSVMVRAPEDLGRRYAAVSGDFNPIHLHAWTARPFGFDRAIAHGMWTLSRAWGEVQELIDVQAPVALSVRFRKPVKLPARLWIAAWPADDEAGGFEICCQSPDGRLTHLEGAVQVGRGVSQVEHA
ncbi:hypothetical protein FRC96_14790 [Lujinxingia vulgaris]|uniref:MaoC-like domain-containing protein n=1 Tax=Lujinxingia vulgaris TaxID=2600176 RepID=A0A5C6X7L4_9DELT|nr:MaoC/PaaZ C-terminal domain-containing protein [Lujinxingia vulgaris]TXD34015.1 hypothetical protein FRC96_14790 [Lujinxingia vulgaris]